MEALTSPKIIVGVHCLKLRTKSMYIQAVVDPAEATFYDKYDQTAYWCVLTQTGLGPDRAARPAGRLLRRARLLQVCEGTGEAIMKKIALSVALSSLTLATLCRQAGVGHGHLRRSANGGGVRRRLRHERRSRDDRTRGAARVEGRSRPAERRRRSTASPSSRRSSADTNLGIHEIGGESTPARAALFVDARATPAQRKALVAMVKSLAGNRHRQRRPGDGRADRVRRRRPRHPRLDRRR